MSDTIPAVGPSLFGNDARVSPSRDIERKPEKQEDSKVSNFGRADVVEAVQSIDKVIKTVADISLSFSIEEDLSRLVVAVRAVGSDEIIRQFPPEEFLTVAKHIAAQNPDMIDEDYLKGILFDQYT